MHADAAGLVVADFPGLLWIGNVVDLEAAGFPLLVTLARIGIMIESL